MNLSKLLLQNYFSLSSHFQVHISQLKFPAFIHSVRCSFFNTLILFARFSSLFQSFISFNAISSIRWQEEIVLQPDNLTNNQWNWIKSLIADDNQSLLLFWQNWINNHSYNNGLELQNFSTKMDIIFFSFITNIRYAFTVVKLICIEIYIVHTC